MNKSIIVFIFMFIFSSSVFAFNIPVLSYHVVTDTPQYDNAWTIGSANFEKHLLYLKNNGFTSWSTEQLINCLNIQCTTTQKPIILTFDDGTKDHILKVAPLLEKYGFRGEFAIITGKIGTSGYMTDEDILELKNRGHSILSHSVNHLWSASLNEQKLRYEFSESKNYLQRFTNTKSYVFPYYGTTENISKICLEYYTLCYADSSGYPLTTDETVNRGAVRRIGLSNANNVTINAFAYYVDRNNPNKNYATLYVNATTYKNITGENTTKNILQDAWTDWTWYTNGKGYYKDGLVVIQEKGSNQQLYQRNIALEPNTEYYVTIKISSTMGSPIRIDILKHTSPYTLYATGWTVQSQGIETEYKNIIRTNSNGRTDARVMLWLGNIKKGEQVKITKIEMVKR